MFTSLDISSSALVAQRVRLDTISSNIANVSTQRNENGELSPYQARYVVFQTDDTIGGDSGGAGVKVASVDIEDVEPDYKFDPQNPLAIREGKWRGYVAYPHINLTTQFVNALEATRAYEANVGVIEVSKNLAEQSLRILA